MGKNELQLITLGLPKDTSKSIIPDERIRLNKISKKSRIDSKKNYCLYCENEFDGFCNYHSIPIFVLKNIAIDGMVYSSYKLVSYNFQDEQIGVNKTNTFQRICRNCDSVIFKDYENPQNYNLNPTAKMINQIAMKNYLRMIDKKYFEIALFDNALDENPSSLLEVNFEKNLISLDLNEYLEEFKSVKTASLENRYKSFRLVYYAKLDYVVPLAFQGLITLISDLKGNVVNDIYNSNSNYRMQNLHVVVMPLKNQTVIMLFINKKRQRYIGFFKQFNNLNEEDKLSVINYMIFSNSEDFILSKTIKNEVLDNENLKKIAEMMSRIDTAYEVKNPLKYITQMYDMEKRHSIPNFLSKEFKI